MRINSKHVRTIDMNYSNSKFNGLLLISSIQSSERSKAPLFYKCQFSYKKQSFIVKRKILQHGIELTAHWILLRFIHNIYSYTTPSVFLLCSWPFNKDLNQRDMSSNVIAIWALDSRHIYQIMKYCSENK